MLRGLFEGPVHAVSGQAGKHTILAQPLKAGVFFLHLDLLGHQNIKISLNFLDKNHWARPFFALFSSIREKLQFTVSFDHPVASGLGNLTRHYVSIDRDSYLYSLEKTSLAFVITLNSCSLKRQINVMYDGSAHST